MSKHRLSGTALNYQKTNTYYTGCNGMTITIMVDRGNKSPIKNTFYENEEVYSIESPDGDPRDLIVIPDNLGFTEKELEILNDILLSPGKNRVIGLESGLNKNELLGFRRKVSKLLGKE